MADEGIPIPQGMGELLGLTPEDIKRKFEEAITLGEKAVNVTGLSMDRIKGLIADTGWELMVDRGEGSPAGGSFFLQNPNYKAPK